jgi:hypothetical protein
VFKRAESVIRAAIFSWQTDSHHLCQLDPRLGAGRLETGTKALGSMRTYSRSGMRSATSVRRDAAHAAVETADRLRTAEQLLGELHSRLEEPLA